MNDLQLFSVTSFKLRTCRAQVNLTSNIRPPIIVRMGSVWFLFQLKFTAIVFSSSTLKPWLVVQRAMLFIAIWSLRSIAGK